MIGWIVLICAASGLFLFVGSVTRPDASGSARYANAVFSAGLVIAAIRMLLLGLHRPRLTLEPRGITDHSTDRGLMRWSDFSYAAREGSTINAIRPPSIRLHTSADVCWHYNQRIPRWRRFSSARLLGSRSIKIRVAGLDHELPWLLNEINSRIEDHSPERDS